MRKHAVRVRISPSLVVSCLALAVSLGGTGYAALKLPAGSVGTPQLKKNAVTTLKVKNRSLLAADFKPGQLPDGAPGAAGAPGPKGDKGDKGDRGDKGDAGAVGVSGYERVYGSIVNLSPGASATLTASCPSGKRALGGGAQVTSFLAQLSFSYAVIDTAWNVGVRNPLAVQIQARAFAVCAVVAP